jgi:hypothetical protein
VLMCADCQVARGRGSGPYPVMTRAEMRAGLDLLPTWALQQKAASQPPGHRSHAPTTGCRRAGGSHAPGAGAGLAGATSRGGRRADCSTEANNREPPRIMTAWVGRLELHCTCLPRPRPGGCSRSDLRFRRTFGVRSCPLLSAVHLSAADPGRTEERFRFRAVADASGVHSPIRTRSPGLSNADTAGQSPWRIWRGLVARRQSTYVGSFVTFSER